MADAAELIREAAARLGSAGFDSPRLDAEVLLRYLLDIDRTRLFLRMHEPISNEQQSDFRALIEQRLTGTPIAYLIGQREFMGLTFLVGPGVLVPRPETELLVEWAIERIRTKAPRLVIDTGTGSGAIIHSVAHHIGPTPATQFIGSDTSPVALGYAATNRAWLGLEHRVNLVLGDLASWAGGPIDLVLANLPYLRPEQVRDNPDIHAEPEVALVSGVDGLDAIIRLIDDLPRIMSIDGAAIFELDPDQAQAVSVAVSARLPGATVTILQDLSGRDRFVVAEFL